MRISGVPRPRANLAYAQLASSEIARDINRDVILELIRSHQPAARADLSRLSGLQPSTVSLIAEQLLKERWIIESGVVARPRGRRPTLLSLNDQLVMLVADVRPHRAIVAVVDLNGRLLARQDITLPSDPERSVDRIIKSMEEMRGRHKGHTFEGIGISLPGRVDPVTKRLVLAPNLRWHDFDIKGQIERRLGLPVELNNAASASLLSELWFGRMDGVRNAVLVTIVEGIGTAILANGQILTGLGGLAGEFGHVPIDPDGPVCTCGQRGCWEVFASSRAALRFYAQALPDAPLVSIQELMQLTEEGNEGAIDAVALQAKNIGRGLRLITAALSPEMILITGDITSSWHRFGPIIEAELRETMLAGPPPRIALTTDVELSRLRGAAATALQRHSGYHASSYSAEKRARRGRAVSQPAALKQVS